MCQSIDTNVKCPHCGAPIVAEVDDVPSIPEMDIPCGPSSGDYYSLQVTAFHCSKCETLFRCPPGRPEAATEIIAKIRNERKAQEEAEDSRSPAIKGFLRSLEP